MMKNTKDTGDQTTLRLITALHANGKKILLPWGDNLRYDFVYEDESGFKRVQCKTARLNSKGRMKFNAYSFDGKKGKQKTSYYGQADLFGVFCPQNSKLFLIPVSAVPLQATIAPVRRCKNSSTVALVSDYELTTESMPPAILNPSSVSIEKEQSSHATRIKKVVLPSHSCPMCQKVTVGSKKFCSNDCRILSQRRTVRPSKEELLDCLKHNKGNIVSIGNYFGVSDNAIRKWLKSANLPSNRNLIKSFLEQEMESSDQGGQADC